MTTDVLRSLHGLTVDELMRLEDAILLNTGDKKEALEEQKLAMCDALSEIMFQMEISQRLEEAEY